ncbi:MAG: HAD family hydrolase, partial [Candidatus Thorarchaeota archaeon]
GRLYFDQYFAGEINYEQWADYDAALWTGEPVSKVMEIVSATKLVPGVRETVTTLSNHGIKTAILSGGLDIMADDIARRAGIEYVLTNKLGIRDGVLTGTVENIIGWAEKADHIHTILNHFGATLEETAFVGDGRNDISVLSAVGLSIAFNPEDEEVADSAQVVIRENDLRAILPRVILGYQR